MLIILKMGGLIRSALCTNAIEQLKLAVNTPLCSPWPIGTDRSQPPTRNIMASMKPSLAGIEPGHMRRRPQGRLNTGLPIF